MTGSKVLDIVVGPDLWWTSNSRLHWRVKARRTKQLRAIARYHAHGRRLVTPVKVTVTVFYPTRRRADPANTSPMVKACLDGFTDAGLWPDDDSEHVTTVTYQRSPDLYPSSYRPAPYVLRFEFHEPEERPVTDPEETTHA